MLKFKKKIGTKSRMKRKSCGTNLKENAYVDYCFIFPYFEDIYVILINVTYPILVDKHMAIILEFLSSH